METQMTQESFDNKKEKRREEKRRAEKMRIEGRRREQVGAGESGWVVTEVTTTEVTRRMSRKGSSVEATYTSPNIGK